MTSSGQDNPYRPPEPAETSASPDATGGVDYPGGWRTIAYIVAAVTIFYAIVALLVDPVREETERNYAGLAAIVLQIFFYVPSGALFGFLLPGSARRKVLNGFCVAALTLLTYMLYAPACTVLVSAEAPVHFILQVILVHVIMTPCFLFLIAAIAKALETQRVARRKT